MSSYDVDLFVIGAGSAGVRLARMAAGLGAKVAIAEDRYMGGTCVNVGCVPKKLFVYASHVAEDLHDAKGFGWQNDGDLRFDWTTLRDNKNAEIQRLNGIYRNLLTNAGVEILEGRATFTSAHTLHINGTSISARHIAITTGSWPFVPQFPGSEKAITSNELFYLEQLPASAVVLGGGYIAVEMAGILNGLGVETTLVYRGDLFLRGFDEEVRLFVKQEIEKKGIKLRFNDNIAAIEGEKGRFTVQMESGMSLDSGLVLAATGRSPHVDDLGLEDLAIAQRSNGEIIVNEHYQTSIEHIFALGDVTGGAQLTPVALAEGTYLAHYLFAECAPQPVNYSLIPTAVFCQPNIGTVGLSEQQARASGANIDVYASEFRALKHTLSGSDERTLMKLIVDRDTDKVLGAHMVGAEAGEIIQGVAVAMQAGARKGDFDRTIGIHPTAAEEFVTMRSPRTQNV